MISQYPIFSLGRNGLTHMFTVGPISTYPTPTPTTVTPPPPAFPSPSCWTGIDLSHSFSYFLVSLLPPWLHRSVVSAIPPMPGLVYSVYCPTACLVFLGSGREVEVCYALLVLAPTSGSNILPNGYESNGPTRRPLKYLSCPNPPWLFSFTEAPYPTTDRSTQVKCCLSESTFLTYLKEERRVQVALMCEDLSLSHPFCTDQVTPCHSARN